MDLIATLLSGPKSLQGEGINHEGERFLGHLEVQPLVAGAAVLLVYTARLEDGSVVHEEATLLGRHLDGALCLWPVMSELPAICPHVQKPSPSAEQATSAVFAFGDRDDRSTFREEISLSFAAGGALTYTHAWGLPGGEFADRSSCLLLPHQDQPCDERLK
jgi:hypothetical protein